MKATTKKGLIIGGVILTLGAIGFLIWRANKKNEEVTEEEATKALEEANKLAGTSVNQTTTPASSGSASSSGTKPSSGSSASSNPVKAPDVKPNAVTKYVYSRVRGVVYANNDEKPTNVKIMEYKGGNEFIGATTGKVINFSNTKFLKVIVKGSNLVGWTPLGFVNQTNQLIRK